MATNRDIFGVDSRIGGTWSLDGAVLEIEDGELLVVTSVQVQYQRATQKFSPLNQNKKYLTAGDPGGGVQLGMVIGPHAAIVGFLQRYTDLCQVKSNVLRISPAGLRYSTDAECNKAFAQVYFLCTGCLINSLSISISKVGELMMFSAGVSMEISGLKIGPTPSGRAGANAGAGVEEAV